MTLSSLVAQDKWQEFDDAWSALMIEEGPTEDLLRALRLVSRKKRMPRCLPMLKEHLKLLGAAERWEESAQLAGEALLGGGAAAEIGPLLVEAAEKAWGERPTWNAHVEIAGLVSGAPDLRKAWKRLLRVMRFEAGSLVFHPGGWGTGEILALDIEGREIEVRFGNGRTDRIPLEGAADIFEPLREEDLRSVQHRDPKNMKKMLKNAPLDVLRAVLERHDGHATTISIRNALMQVGVEGGSWSAWWRKTRKLAETSEWFRVSGTPQRGEVKLLHTAADPVEAARERLEGASLHDTVTYVRDALDDAKQTGALADFLIDALDERLAGAAADEASAISGWMLVRGHRGTTPEELAQHLRAAAEQPDPEDPTEVPALWRLFSTLTLAKEQERMIPALEEVLGDAWREEAVKNLAHAPSGMIRALLETLLTAKQQEQLNLRYRELLARPLRSPDVLIALSKAAQAGKLGDDLPPPEQRAEALLALGTNLHVNRKTDAAVGRSHTRLVEFLMSGSDEPLLTRLLENAPHEQLAGLQRLVQRGVDEAVDNLVLELYLRKAPVDTTKSTWFWENDSIWTTAAGRARRAAELKHLVEVKIPENQDAIGKAAAMGDLSENYEWTSAIEEQGNLAGRRKMLEDELARADFIEEAPLPEGTVAPGTWVRYRDLLTNEQSQISILGPWDVEQGDDIVSYRAPLAWGLLGKKPGEGANISLPSGEVELEVLEIGTVDLSDLDHAPTGSAQTAGEDAG